VATMFVCASTGVNLHDHRADGERTLQLGSVSRLCTLVRSVDTLCTGLHWSWIRSRHSVPSCAAQHEGEVGVFEVLTSSKFKPEQGGQVACRGTW
jgi:hypothetical protein